MTDAAASARTEIVRVCRRLAERGLIAGRDGNVSARLADGRVVATPAGRSKGDLRPDELVELSLDGAVQGGGTPSTEIALHLAAYRARADVHAVVHAHPPHATAFAVAGVPLPVNQLAELVFNVGHVPTVPYVTPGTAELAAKFVAFLDGFDVALLSNHGAVAVGATLDEALQRMESLDHGARILLNAHILGTATPLSGDAVRTLDIARRRSRAIEVERRPRAPSLTRRGGRGE